MSLLMRLSQFDNVIDEVATEWHEQLYSIILSSHKHGTAQLISGVSFKNKSGWKEYALLDNGKVYAVKIERVPDGITWNGDDSYIPAYKSVIDFIKEVGEVDFKSMADEDDDTFTENIACQMIEILREN